jgi:hypothetical protein
MFKLIVCIAVITRSFVAFSQSDPVHWKISATKLESNRYNVILHATIDPPWHIYTAKQYDNTEFFTKIEFQSTPLVLVDTAMAEKGKLIAKYEPELKLTQRFYAFEVQFIKEVIRKGKAKTMLNGTIEYVACNGFQCLPLKVRPFTVTLQ